jgi:hypothetical protein
MVNDMMKKEGWTRSYTLSVLSSKFESEERHQEVAYVNDLIKKQDEDQEKEEGPGSGPTITTNIAEEEEIPNTTIEPRISSSRNLSKLTRRQQLQQRRKTIPLTSLSKQLDKQSIQMNKIMQLLQPIQKQIKSAEKQPVLIKQIQSQVTQLQKQISQVQKKIKQIEHKRKLNKKSVDIQD